MKDILRKFINLVLIAIVIYSSYTIYEKLTSYEAASATYNEIRKKKKESLSVKNPDFKFWLKIDNTNIDYPVVQSNNNSYYLSKDFYNNESSSGSIFIDYKNKSTDKNIILYGHNMRNKTMFNNLLKFKNENFFNENNKIHILKDNKEYIYEVFSVYTVDAGYDYLITSFSSDHHFLQYIDDIKSNSLFNTEIDISSDDNIITLSTCSYEFKDARTVVHGKLTK